MRPPVLILFFCLLGTALRAQSGEPKQAICQASWERCLGGGGGKNWKPIYDRCLKARNVCLGGEAYLPEVPQNFSSATLTTTDSGSDQANDDPTTAATLCDNGQPRGARNGCILAAAGEGYGPSFSLLGPGVPLARTQRASSVVKCAGGKAAMFYPNGRIQSCTIDGGAMEMPLTDQSGKVAHCAARMLVRFDSEGRMLSCDAP